MTVDALTIRNFRNIAAIDVEFPEAGVVILGENGHGKTNLLEAVYYLVLFRSLRGAKDRELVRFDTDGFFVAGTSGSRVTAGYEVRGRRKKVTVDGTPVTKLGSAVGRIIAVPFSPTDRELVAGGPGARRRYIDVLLAISCPGYLGLLAQLRSALKQRNAALRSGDVAAATVFDAPVAAAAVPVASRRIDWVRQWRERFSELCLALGERAGPAMEYHPIGWSPAGGCEGMLETLVGTRNRDIRRGTTTVGPHHDDLSLSMGGRALRMFGSAGQQRTTAIALRLLEAETLANETGHTPIALYDDVFVELDQGRQRRLLTLIQDSLPGQAIVTAPRDSEVPEELLDRPRWTMARGQLAVA